MGSKRKLLHYRYLLGDASREAARLRRQARLWDPTARALFDRLGVRRGWSVLEIGPGQGSLHLELLPHHYDLIFTRWVFLFLPEPETHLRKLVRALRPGGLLAVEDYWRETFALVPRPPEWENFIEADRAFFASQGGDVSVGGRLPELFGRWGLNLVEVVPAISFGRPGSPVWRWLSDYFLGIMGRYAGRAPFSRAQAASLRRHWRAAARARTSVMISPTVLDVVGRKRR